MAWSTAEEKKSLRAQVRRALEGLSPREREESDRLLFARFLALRQVEQAGTVFAFWGIPPREPETALLVDELCRRGKRVVLPRMRPERGMETRLYDPQRSLLPAAFGILEPGENCPPVAREEIDLVLVPGLCYDRQGYRLGFGGGYYDRWLAGFPGLRVGLCREAVLQDRLPVEHHDLPVDLVVTESECLSCSFR